MNETARNAPRSELLPNDPYDAELLAHARPPGWTNPTPARRYNLVVLGAGTAGLVTAAGAAALGAKVALVEKNLLGGDCLNFGCVPSKALLRSARFYADLRDAARFTGSVLAPSEADFAAAMERMRRLRARISHHDSVKRLRDLGVDVFLGEATFVDRRRVEVAGATLTFKKAVVATGSHAAHPAIDGLEEAGYQTNETIFDLTERPRRLLVVGGGPLGCELAQAFSRLGCEVTIASQEPYFLPGEERDAAEILADSLRRDGIDVRLNTQVKSVTREGGEKRARLIDYDQDTTVAMDEILVGVGRIPNVLGLNLEAAGVLFDQENGVRVNDYLQTANRNVYAAGDVAVERKYTHMADATARIVIQNALFWGRKKLSSLTIPWCTYTDPEIAHVGVYVKEAREQGFGMKTFTVPMSEVDRAVLDGEEEGFVKIHVREGSDTILGATIVARHAGEMINEISLAMVAGIGLKTVSQVIHSYPTQAEAIRKAGDAYNRTRLPPFLKAISRRWLAWSRG
ncbi:MAG TPA: mercuric reductase [Thermoanaerobaculia bacterium]|nr:mercuric reductase [Thermoanaerobaculia bacterium]